MITAKLKPQALDVLAHLQSGKTITDAQARKLYGIARLGARTHELKQAGYDVRTDLVNVKTRRGKSRVASYYLNTPEA
jgi:hypothetical protein